jgi:hypothetical protein
MPRVAILIAASPTRAFYSQLAAFSLAIRRITWSRWEPRVHVYIGGEYDPNAYADWRLHLREVDVSWVSHARFEREGDWAQSDDVFRFAPRDVDVLLAMDADTLPVVSLETVLDRVLETGSVAGALAHYPVPHTFDVATSASSLQPGSSSFPDRSVRDSWERLARGLLDVPLEFRFCHSLMDPSSPDEHRHAPFYLNFGVVFFPAASFDDVARRYLTIRPTVAERLHEPAYSGQVALTLAVTAAGVRTWALPMRYNFPNDPVAERMYPEELAQVAVFHYLRTGKFDRHAIFTNPEEYHRFLGLQLTGVDLRFQESVRDIIGSTYPFI